MHYFIKILIDNMLIIHYNCDEFFRPVFPYPDKIDISSNNHGVYKSIQNNISFSLLVNGG